MPELHVQGTVYLIVSHSLLLYTVLQKAHTSFDVRVGFKMMLFIASDCFINNNSNIDTYEPVQEKINNLGFRPGPTQTRLYCHRIKLEA